MKRAFLLTAFIIISIVTPVIALPAFAENTVSAEIKTCNVPFGFLFARFLSNGNHYGRFKHCAADIKAPIISDIEVQRHSDTSVTITWKTNERAASEVVYGIDDLDESSGYKSGLKTEHSVRLSGLKKDTRYRYQIIAWDFFGNKSVSARSTFRTTAEDKAGDPDISEIRVSSISESGAVISWHTNESASGVVSYGRNDSYGNTTSRTAMDTDQAVTLSGLADNTTYHYSISVRDSDGNVTASSDRVFTTRKDDDVDDPVITDIVVTNIATHSAEISWKTNEAATTEIIYESEYGDEDRIIDSDLTRSHAMTLVGLSPDTTYTFRVISEDASGNRFVSSLHTFTTDREDPRVIYSNWFTHSRDFFDRMHDWDDDHKDKNGDHKDRR